MRLFPIEEDPAEAQRRADEEAMHARYGTCPCGAYRQMYYRIHERSSWMLLEMLCSDLECTAQ